MVRILQWPFIYFSEATVEDQVPGVICLHEREIEALVRGKLTAEEEHRCQAHLLWCQSCLSRVEEEAEFARATRDAAVLLQQQEAEATKRGTSFNELYRRVLNSFRNLFSRPFSMRWALVAMSACALIAMFGLHHARWRDNAGVDVLLQSERGSAVPVSIESDASTNIRMRIDAADVGPASTFRVVVVDGWGRAVEAMSASAISGSVHVALHHGLAPGQYWVRLFTPGGQLLREYALRVKP